MHPDCKLVLEFGDSNCWAAIHGHNGGVVFHQQPVIVTQHAPQAVEVLPWTSRTPDISPTESAWDIIGRQLQCHPEP
ncbi:uncharacterized protein TNCV_3864901 [Trichonephila clavipes]|nr:uncharacterized protein TNCV_3864901 [Trichonephila clavipes]